MAFLRCEHLPLSDDWGGKTDRKHIVLVRGADAPGLENSRDYERVHSAVAVKELRRHAKDRERPIRVFYERTMADRPDTVPRRLSEALDEMADFIKAGALVGLRGTRAELWNEEDPNMEERLLVREIEVGARGHLHDGGRRYKLVAGADLAKVPDRNSYEVVRHDEAVRVLQGLAKQHSAQPSLVESFGKAQARLSPDWGPPRKPKGLVLLRKIAQQRTTGSRPEPAITPSQMRAMVEEQAAIITFLEVPEFIASGSETVALRYGFRDPHHRLTDVVLQIFTEDDRAVPIWSRKVPADHVAAGEGSLDWNGKVDSAGDDFPDGFATLVASPYVVRLSAKEGSGSQKREAKIRVEVAEVRLAFGPESCLSKAGDREVFRRMQSVNGTYFLALPARSFAIAYGGHDLDEVGDTGHQEAMAPWDNGDGPRIPLVATVLVQSSQRQAKLAGKALGRARVLWDYVEPAPGAVPNESATSGTYLRSVERHDKENAGPPNGRNAPRALGGKRGNKDTAQPVMVGPDAQIKDFPFATEAGKTRFWAAFTEPQRQGDREGQAGVVFRPSAISGDAYRISAYVDVDGSLDSLAAIPEKVPCAHFGWLEVLREVPLVRFVRKCQEVQVAFADITSFMGPAYLRWDDRCSNKLEVLDKATYLAAVQAGVSKLRPGLDKLFDRHALLPVSEQYDQEAGFFTKAIWGIAREPRTEMLSFRTFAEFLEACRKDPSTDQEDYKEWQYATEWSYLDDVRRRAWTLAGYVAQPLAASGGISIAAFSHTHNLGSYGQFGGLACWQDHDRSKTTIALFTSDPGTLAHELGHCLFLPHAPSAPAIEIGGVMVERHIPNPANCIMSYDPVRPGYCAICLLRLRGADGAHLKSAGIAP